LKECHPKSPDIVKSNTFFQGLILEFQPSLNSFRTVDSCDISSRTHVLLDNLKVFARYLHVLHVCTPALFANALCMPCVFQGQVARKQRLLSFYSSLPTSSDSSTPHMDPETSPQGTGGECQLPVRSSPLLLALRRWSQPYSV
jgi:hypothetical protein